jgi:hypothetical protein
MRKFSDNKLKSINESSKKDISNDDRMYLLSIMDDLLSIETYGSVDSRYLNGKTVIKGKELLADAILDMISEKSVGVLENLKHRIKDWQLIDEEISKIKVDKSITNILERWGSDEDLLFSILKRKIDRVTNVERLNEWYNSINNTDLDQKFKKDVSKIIKIRYQLIS